MTLQTPDTPPRHQDNTEIYPYTDDSYPETTKSELDRLFPQERILSFFYAIKIFENFLIENGTQLTNGKTGEKHTSYTSTISISKEQLEQIPAQITAKESAGIFRDPNNDLFLRMPTGETIELAQIPDQEFETIYGQIPNGSGNPWIFESTLRIVAHYFPEFFASFKKHTGDLFEKSPERLNIEQYKAPIAQINSLQEHKSTLKLEIFIEYFRAFVSIIQSSLLSDEELEGLYTKDSSPADTKRTTIAIYINNLPEDGNLRQETINTIKGIIEEYKKLQLGDVARNILTTLFGLVHFLYREKSSNDQAENNSDSPSEP